MPTAAISKPKRIVKKEDIQSEVAPNPLLDPALAGIVQTARPECAPVAGVVVARAQQERERRAKERSISSETNGQNGQWAFVKNGNFKELITFKDGATFTFPSTIFVTDDKELADKILEVASTSNICLK
jgi:hypothetical protein